MPSSPTEIYAAFLVAYINGDRATAEKLCVPNPELDVLFKKPLLPKVQRDFIIGSMKKEGYRIVKIGETVAFPDGDKKIWDEASEKALEKSGTVLIVGAWEPWPHLVRKVNGVWKADAGDLIELRKMGQARGNK